MDAFNKVIGYAPIKQELTQILDIIKNDDAYAKLGASAPRGLLIHGKPGLGKTLMATCLAEASGRYTVICRKTAGREEFIRTIREAFEEAAANEPAIVFLDDMDKFANDDERHQNSDEFVTVQSCIDEYKESAVFVLATANNLRNLPNSLLRAGRFDRRIKVKEPTGDDAVDVVAHYLSTKKIANDVDPQVVASIMGNCSCAELETVVNQAGLLAGSERAKKIAMHHIIEACLVCVYDVSPSAFLPTPPIDIKSTSRQSQVIWHEAGHVVASELLSPKSVFLAFAHTTNKAEQGFVVSSLENDPSLDIAKIETIIMTGLGGKAAVDMRMGAFSVGCEDDISKAARYLSDLIDDEAYAGFALADLHCTNRNQTLEMARQHVQSALLSIYYQKTKELLRSHEGFLTAIATELAEKKVLTAIDIDRIRAETIPLAA